ncbi:MAG: hypothetical protein NTZ34_03150 [Chloroflexi bacterium]|nr:hypothetical protein [Chloroflexota bacterium]
MDVMAMTKFKVIQVLLAVSLICSVLFLLPHAAMADGPTHAFYGTVSYNGKIVGEGYVVTAMVNGKEVASATTDDQGKWGVSQPFTVAIGGCALIEFYVNGDLVGSASSCIATNELNLTASWAPHTSASTASAASTTVPAVSGTDNSLPSSSSADSGSQSPSSTQTFFIGPQPSVSSSPSDSPLSQPTHTSSQSSTAQTPAAAPDSETIPPAADFPIAKTSLQDGVASTSPAGAPISVTEVLVMGAIVVWSILIVFVFLAIIRKRPDY